MAIAKVPIAIGTKGSGGYRASIPVFRASGAISRKMPPGSRQGEGEMGQIGWERLEGLEIQRL